MKSMFHSLFAALMLLASCSSGVGYELPPGYKEPDKKNDTTSTQDPIVQRAPAKHTDLVLIYDGNKARTFNWTTSYLKDYVLYTDESGKNHWFFDGFLIFDFRDSGGTGSLEKTYAYGYKNWGGTPLDSANKSDWQYFLDRWLGDNGVCDNLEKTVAECAKTMGDLPYQREVVIGVPEAITHQNWNDNGTPTKYWGSVNGQELDFSRQADKNIALEWFMNEAVRMFESKRYKNIRLVGFYFINESYSTCQASMQYVTKYCKENKFESYWIPYYKAPGYELWNLLGFSRAYLQPNYFFQQSGNEDQVLNTCTLAKKNNMYLEFECDDTVYQSEEGRRKFRKYMDGFIEGGCYNMPYAYYQSGCVFHLMKRGDAPTKELYNDFCHWVIERPNRLTK